MKDERIVKAFDSIAPDDAAKSRMLKAIMDAQAQDSPAGNVAPMASAAQVPPVMSANDSSIASAPAHRSPNRPKEKVPASGSSSASAAQVPPAAPVLQTKKKRKPLRGLAIAACMVLALGVGAYVLMDGFAPVDESAPKSVAELAAEAEVNDQTDPFVHEGSNMNDSAPQSESASGAQSSAADEADNSSRSAKSKSSKVFAEMYVLMWNGVQYSPSQIEAGGIGKSLGTGSLLALTNDEDAWATEVFECTDSLFGDAVVACLPEEEGVFVLFFPA